MMQRVTGAVAGLSPWSKGLLGVLIALYALSFIPAVYRALAITPGK
jgi:hypothetical protein